MATQDSLIFEIDDGVAIITLNRPDRGNSLDDSLRSGIRAAWAEINSNPAIGVAIITAAGERHFCTGADVGRLSRERSGNDPEAERKAGPGGWGPRHYGVEKPVICAVNGLASGAGLHFVADSDIVLATRTASFMDTHVGIGQVGALENIGIAKRMPLGTALRITLMGKAYRLPAERAYQLGLVDELYDRRDEMIAAAKEMARIMLGNSPSAMARSKKAIWDSLEMPYGAALANGWEMICEQRHHPDALEGVTAYSERRPPRWLRK